MVIITIEVRFHLHNLAKNLIILAYFLKIKLIITCYTKGIRNYNQKKNKILKKLKIIIID